MIRTALIVALALPMAHSSASADDGRAVVIDLNAPKRSLYPIAIPRAAMATDLRFIKLLDRVAQQERGTVIFLVRPNGVGNYYHGKNIARTRYCRNGKLPVPGEGALDLSVFRNMLEKNPTN